jgi:signal transduction histidine kinase
MKFLRNHLGIKLLGSYLLVILVGMLVLFIASQWILPTAFSRHMNGNGFGMMGGQSPGGGMMQGPYSEFRASFNEALLIAGFVASAIAIIVSIVLSQSVIAPLRAVMDASQQIAGGHYEERLQVRSTDELGQLATRFNQMAEKLEQVESMRRRLIGDVSHELRTPLTAIKGSMEALMDGILPATQATFYQIHSEADRLNRLVDDLQELSRVEARAYELKIRPVDVRSTVQTVTNRLAPHFESKHITLDLGLRAELPRVLVDEDRVVQVLTNLIANAIQHTRDGGIVRLSAVQVNDELQISVGDNGVGIPPEHLAHIFDRFYRVDKSRSRQAGGGSGIGLTIAKHFVEAMGGRIWAESEGESKGSVFTFTLPLAR